MASVADFGSTEANDLTHERRGPSPWVAGLLTVLAPGLGHIYIGEARRGITLIEQLGPIVTSRQIVAFGATRVVGWMDGRRCTSMLHNHRFFSRAIV